MNTTSIGQQAEEVVSNNLRHLGYKIVERNWKTKYCEIDIVAQNKKEVLFVEVKYRLSDTQGSGLDYVTHKKQQQMAFAAEMWVQAHNWSGNYGLAAVEVSGADFVAGELILLD